MFILTICTTRIIIGIKLIGTYKYKEDKKKKTHTKIDTKANYCDCEL